MQDYCFIASIGAAWYDPSIFLVRADDTAAARRIAERMLSAGDYQAIELRTAGRRLFTLTATGATDRLAA